MILDILQTFGAILGILGAFQVASSSRKWRLVGFIVWLVSNAVLMTWSISISAWAVSGMQCFFFISNIIGIWNNLKDEPAKVIHVYAFDPNPVQVRAIAEIPATIRPQFETGGLVINEDSEEPESRR